MANLLPVSSRLAVSLTLAVTLVLIGTAAVDIHFQVRDAGAAYSVAQLSPDETASRVDILRGELWVRALWRTLVRVVAIVAFTLLILRWTLSGSIARSAQWLRDLRLGRIKPILPKGEGLLMP